MIIYKATNKVNQKIYIGQTAESISIRETKHYSDSKLFNKNCYFNKAIRKYGRNNFIWEEIDSADSFEELDYMEKYWIKFYSSNNRKYGYNLAEGGNVNRGFKKTKEQKEQISKTLKLKYASGEIKIWCEGKTIDNMKRNRKSIICIETGVIYDSVWKAAKLTNLCRQGIMRVLKGKGQICGGFHWEYVS